MTKTSASRNDDGIMILYLAGPDVFLPDAVEIGRRKVALCETHGVTGLFPLDNEIDLAGRDASLKIFRANQAMMDRADAIVANLTPFRGPSADAGTVYELGYMAGKGKRCFAYCNDPRVYADRIEGVTARDGVTFDADGLIVEDFGHADNLMMIHALDDYGAQLVLPATMPADIWRDLAAFDRCLQIAVNS